MPILHSWWKFRPALLATLLLAACAAPTRTEVSFEGEAQPVLARHEALVLLPVLGKQIAPGEVDFVRCISDSLEKQLANRANVVDAAVFRDALFPWFEAQHAPSDMAEMHDLLSRPPVRERIASLGIRYAINIAAKAESDGFPSIFCGAGYGGGGCLGVMWEDKTLQVRATIWDLVTGVEFGALSTRTEGRSAGAAFGIPVLFIANTQKDACSVVAAELGRLLSKAREVGDDRE